MMEIVFYFIGYLAIGLIFCHFIDSKRKWDERKVLIAIALWPLVTIAAVAICGLNSLGWGNDD